MVVLEKRRRPIYHEADIKNTRRAHHRSAHAVRVDLLRSAVLLLFHPRPRRNGSRHPRCAGSAYRSGHKWDYRAGDGVPRQPVRNPDGSGVAAWLAAKHERFYKNLHFQELIAIY